jgi:PKD repeat protein/predicted GH43/DUF377 family glycosyl hydrolase
MNPRRIVPLLALVVLLLAALPAATAARPAPPNALDKVESLVLEEIATAGRTDFFVWLAEKADLSPAEQLRTKLEKGRFVYQALVAAAERTQKDLRAALDRQGAHYQSYYIANKVLVYDGDQALLAQLAARPDVAQVTANHQFQLQDPVKKEPAPARAEDVESNLAFIKAPQVWALGYTGQGTVLGNNDTGLDETHPALARHYRGCLNPPACTQWDHNYNWWDATDTYPTNPYDGYGHGTHTTGTMVGDDGGTNQIGVAPGAQTIHCKMIRDNNTSDDAIVTECLQWDLAPWDLLGGNPRPDLAPDTLNNSWGYPGGNQNQFRDEILALQSAGILVEVSAGNEGPNCATLRSPGDYNEVLTTGSVWHFAPFPGRITEFSSRGPSDLDPTPPFYFPDVMAPGEFVRSSLPGGGYEHWSGTSMAGPHVTALVGLLWSANPALRGKVALTMQIIQDTAVPLTGQGGSNCGGDYTTGPNNDWGYGTIDALAAVQAALALGGAGHLQGHVYDAVSAEPIENATVLAYRDGGSASVQTDAAGYYTMTALAGSYTVTASAFNSISVTVGGVAIVTGTTRTQDFSLTPLPTLVVSGTVSDAATGAPLSATVRILYTGLASAHSNPVTGFYALRVVPGTYTFLVESWGYHPLARTVVVDHDQGQDFVLVPLPFVPFSGNPVLDAGPPGAWDGKGTLAFPEIVQVDGLNYLFYTGIDWTDLRHAIGYATSTNGLDFTRAISNPILTGDGSGFDSYGVWMPRVLLENGTWVLYYGGVSYYSPQENGYQVGRATAPGPDGPWTRSQDPVLTTGSYTEWDRASVCPNRIIATADGYVMYYNGGLPNDTAIQIGMATSPDGITWTKYNDPSTPNPPYVESDPVLPLGAYGEWDAATVVGGYARQTASGWEMLYTGVDSSWASISLGYAASADGIHWHKYAGNPVLEPRDDPVATYRVAFPATVLSDTTYLVYYDYIAPGAIGLATGRVCMPLAEALFTWQPVTPTTGDTITLTASAAGTDPVAFTWDLGDGTVGSGRTMSHTYAAAGTYAVTLTATNCETGTATAVHTITVQPPCVPVADAAFSWLPLIPPVGQAVTFTGTVAAGDPPISYTWDLGDSSFVFGPSSITHTYSATGTYTVIMTATNCGGATATAVHTVTVTCPDVAGAAFSWTPDPPAPQEVVTFTGRAESPRPLTYTWKLEDGSWKEGQVVTHSYALPGVYPVVMTATSDCGTWQAVTHTVTVACPEVSDTSFAWTPPAPVAGDPVTFTATASSLRPLTYAWDLGDSSFVFGPSSITHTYTAPGPYTVIVTATNDCGAGQTVTHTVGVEPRCEGVSIVTVTAAVAECVATLDAELTGTEPFSYLWDLGPFGAYPSASPVVDFQATGVYTGTLSVWNCGNAEPATFSFTVQVACDQWHLIYLPLVVRGAP